jgi:5'-nucleotidase
MLGLEVVAPDTELVLTGINNGPNMGCDVFYSGTVAAAREGYFGNRRSIAVSLVTDSFPPPQKEHYETAVYAVEALTANLEVFFGGLTAALLNVNVPNLPLSETKGFKISFAGRRRYQERVQRGSVPGRGPCYWVQGVTMDSEEEEGSDVKAVNDGFIALTFLQHDTTDYELNRRIGVEEIAKLNA